MTLDETIDLTLEFVEWVYKLYCSGELTFNDYSELTYTKLHFIEAQINKVDNYSLKARCEKVLENNTNWFNTQGELRS